MSWEEIQTFLMKNFSYDFFPHKGGPLQLLEKNFSLNHLNKQLLFVLDEREKNNFLH